MRNLAANLERKKSGEISRPTVRFQDQQCPKKEPVSDACLVVLVVQCGSTVIPRWRMRIECQTFKETVIPLFIVDPAVIPR
jgi:hypothetical protein